MMIYADSNLKYVSVIVQWSRERHLIVAIVSDMFRR